MENFLLALEYDDVTKMLAAEDGFKVEHNAVDGPNSGRDLAANMHRDKVADKAKIYCKCRPIRYAEAAILFPHLKQNFVTVRYFDLIDCCEHTKQMYCTQVTATLLFRKPDGTRWYKDVTFNLIER